MALGAQPKNILTDVLLQCLTIAGIGVGAGVVFGVVFARINAVEALRSE
jgi:putative ABC transport system permease protein